jgi:hypothetical protein
LKVRVAAGEFKARFPEIELLAARRIATPACTAKFATVMERVVLLDTDPDVRRAKVGERVGFRAAVMSMFPELLPPTSPILRTLAETLLTSADTRDSWAAFSDPRLITLELVCGAIVTVDVPPTETDELIAIELAFSNMFPVADIGWLTVITPDGLVTVRLPVAVMGWLTLTDPVELVIEEFLVAVSVDPTFRFVEDVINRSRPAVIAAPTPTPPVPRLEKSCADSKTTSLPA